MTNAVISVDLAFKSPFDLGIMVLRSNGASTTFDQYRLPGGLGRGALDPIELSAYLDELAGLVGADTLLLDGPQGWRQEVSTLPHCRACERALNTPAKTGLPGIVKPAAYTKFVAFSVAVFDALDRLGWPRLSAVAELSGHGRRTVESFPMASWRSLRLPPLPAKAKATPERIEQARTLLQAMIPFPLPSDLSHDELQATVAGYSYLSRFGPTPIQPVLHGTAPFLEGGICREGFILVPTVQQ